MGTQAGERNWRIVARPVPEGGDKFDRALAAAIDWGEVGDAVRLVNGRIVSHTHPITENVDDGMLIPGHLDCDCTEYEHHLVCIKLQERYQWAQDKLPQAFAKRVAKARKHMTADERRIANQVLRGPRSPMDATKRCIPLLCELLAYYEANLQPALTTRYTADGTPS